MQRSGWEISHKTGMTSRIKNRAEILFKVKVGMTISSLRPRIWDRVQGATFKHGLRICSPKRTRIMGLFLLSIWMAIEASIINSSFSKRYLSLNQWYKFKSQSRCLKLQRGEKMWVWQTRLSWLMLTIKTEEIRWILWKHLHWSKGVNSNLKT